MFVLAACEICYGQAATIESAPPVVVKTVPEAGAKDVDPSLTEIKVTFSKDMADGSWSWSTAWKDSTPQSAGSSEVSGRQAHVRAAGEIGIRKGVWLLAELGEVPQLQRRHGGRPAVPYLLMFKTK